MDKNIKKKEYVRTMRSDFGTSTSEHQIATNIAIMSSVQVTYINTKYKYDTLSANVVNLFRKRYQNSDDQHDEKNIFF